MLKGITLKYKHINNLMYIVGNWINISRKNYTIKLLSKIAFN